MGAVQGRSRDCVQFQNHNWWELSPGMGVSSGKFQTWCTLPSDWEVIGLVKWVLPVVQPRDHLNSLQTKGEHSVVRVLACDFLVKWLEYWDTARFNSLLCLRGGRNLNGALTSQESSLTTELSDILMGGSADAVLLWINNENVIGAGGLDPVGQNHSHALFFSFWPNN